MFDMNLPHLTDQGARDLGKDIGAELSANLLKIVRAPVTMVVVCGSLALCAGWLGFAVYKQVIMAPPVQHDVKHSVVVTALPPASTSTTPL